MTGEFIRNSDDWGKLREYFESWQAPYSSAGHWFTSDALWDKTSVVDRMKTDYLEKRSLFMGLFDSEELRGIISLESINSTAGSAEIHMYLPETLLKNKTFSQSLKDLLFSAFENLSLQKLILFLSEEAKAAQVVLKSFGFEEEGYLKNMYTDDGNLFGLTLWGLEKKRCLVLS